MIILKIIFMLIAGVLVYQLFMAIFGYKYTSEYKTAARLDAMASENFNLSTASLVKEKESPFSFIKITESLRRRLMVSGIKLKPEEFIVFWFVATILPSIFYIALNGYSPLIYLLMVLGFIAPLMYLKVSENKRKKAFNDQLNDTLIIISNSIRSGFTFKNALERVAEDMPAPMSEEISRVTREVAYGASLADSLGELAQRMDSKELEMINTAVSIQQRSGGNLAEIIDKVSETIKDRIAMKRKIIALSTQGRMSAVVIGGLPIFLFIVLMFINPEYMSFFTTEKIGVIALIFSGVWELLGIMFINKIIKIEV